MISITAAAQHLSNAEDISQSIWVRKTEDWRLKFWNKLAQLNLLKQSDNIAAAAAGTMRNPKLW